MLPNERFALECRAYYDEIGLVVDERNGEFAHSPLTRKECDTGYYLLHGHHQHQGLLQSRDLGECCFFKGHTKKWLIECDYFPEDYFELWDIYDEFSGKNASITLKNRYAEKNEDGKSVYSLELNKKLHAKKDENGKSAHAVRAGSRSAEKLHEEKEENGKSRHAVKMGKAGAEKTHSRKNEKGLSLHTLAIHEKKDENGRSVVAMKTLSQVWQSTIDGFQSTPGGVALHNKANGWDPSARVKIEVG